MKCKNCKTELAKDEKRDCLVCLTCHPVSNTPPPPPKKGNVKIDEPWTDERVWKVVETKVRELFVDLIEDYVIAQSKDETPVVNTEPPKDWREQAKSLGIPLAQETGGARKKIDVLADIAEKTKASQGDNNDSP